MLKLNSYKQFGIVYLVWWLVWLSFQTLAIHQMGIDWLRSFVDALISTVLMFLAGYIIINTFRFYTPGFVNYFFRLLHVIVLSLLSVFVLHWLLAKMFSEQFDYLIFLEKSLPIRYLFSLLMMAFMALVSGLQFYMEEQLRYKQRRDEAEQLFRDAELTKLRQQLQPHFLFNSLNSINALLSSKPDQARKMIEQLSDFLRLSFKTDEHRLVDFSEELCHVQLYLDIEKVRFGHRLLVDINMDENCLTMKVPSLLLQPVLENAVKFGLYGTTEDVTITLSIQTINNMLTIQIENPFDTETSAASKGTGFGLGAVQKRLSLLYGRNDLLTTTQNENKFITTITVPQKQ